MLFDISASLDAIVAVGNRGHIGTYESGQIICADGFTVSVIAGGGTYCRPRPALCFHTPGHDMVHEPWAPYEQEPHDFAGPYTHLEVGFPSMRPEPWGEWQHCAEDPDAPTETVYSYVPVEMVRDLVALHGGEV